MQRYYSFEEIPHEPKTALSIGTFDGVHRGHRSILSELIRVTREIEGRSIVVTFDPHPQEILRKTGSSVPILTPLEAKLQLFESLDIDGVLVLPFTKEFASIPWQRFVDTIVEGVGLTHIVVGHDHAFGKGREGNAKSLRSYGEEKGFDVTQVDPLVVDDVTISSTKIRNALLDGNLDAANTWLTYPYHIAGRVVHGDGRGKKLGIPTANIQPTNDTQLIPSNGVYCVRCHLEDRNETVGGMANIGVRPSFTDGTKRTIEAHLFSFADELYNESVTIEFRKFIRSEQIFDSPDDFLRQLERDRAISEEYLAGIDEGTDTQA